jgi:hypothetical protein
MEKIKNYFPTALLISYVIYSAFIPVTIAHSIIVIALVVLFGLQFHISRQEINKYNEKVLEGLKNEMDEKLANYEKRMARLEDEIGKTQLSVAGAKNAPEKQPQPRKISW